MERPSLSFHPMISLNFVHLARFLTSLSVLTSLLGCDAQNFSTIDPPLYVSLKNQRHVDQIPTLDHHELTRHAVDFKLSNPSDLNAQVVIWAQSQSSEDDGTFRITGEKKKVFDLAPSQVITGRFSDLDLKVGTRLDFALQCCDHSQCTEDEVACPPLDEQGLCPSENAQVCIDHCLERSKETWMTCLSTCLSTYYRCCGYPEISPQQQIPCCLEPCSSRHCLAASVTCTQTQSPSETLDCSELPQTCIDGCLDNEQHLDPRCTMACLSAFDSCCENPPPIDDKVSIPSCFAPGCESPDHRVLWSDFQCPDSKLCLWPEICAQSCQDSDLHQNLQCLAACSRAFRSCCLNDGLQIYPTASIPCCFNDCESLTELCAYDQVQCDDRIACEAYPISCVEACHQDEIMDLHCLEACLDKYTQCCEAQGYVPLSSGLLFSDPEMSIPCCFSPHCEAQLEGVIVFGAIECRDDSECDSGQFCNDRLLCESKVGDVEQGCQVSRPLAPSPLSPALKWFGILAFSLLWFLRKKKPRNVWLKPLIFVWFGLWPSTCVRAAEPLGFRRGHSTLMSGIYLSQFSGGQLSSFVDLGVGVSFQEMVQKGHWGFTTRLAWAYYQTHQPPLPFDRGIQYGHLALAPRYLYPFGRHWIAVFQIEYVYLSALSNVLIEYSQGKHLFHSGGLWLAVQYLKGGSLFEFAISSTYVPETQSVMWMFSLNAGIFGFH